MREENRDKAPAALASRHLCTVEFEVGGGLIAIGASPFGDQRLGYITGGRFFGPRLNGLVLPGGANWSPGGRLGEGSSDRKSAGWGKGVSIRLILGGPSYI